MVWRQRWPLVVGGLCDRWGVAEGSAARCEGASPLVGVVAGASGSREGKEAGGKFRNERSDKFGGCSCWWTCVFHLVCWFSHAVVSLVLVM